MGSSQGWAWPGDRGRLFRNPCWVLCEPLWKKKRDLELDVGSPGRVGLISLPQCYQLSHQRLVGAAGWVQAQAQVAEEGLSIVSFMAFNQFFARACSPGAWYLVICLKAFPISQRCSGPRGNPTSKNRLQR